MTIEIKQLIIRAVARSPQEQPPAPPIRLQARTPHDDARLVSACVKQVLHVLEKSRER